MSLLTSNGEIPYHILLVEDNAGDAHLFREYLREQDKFVVTHCERLRDALQLLQSPTVTIDVILLDLSLPDSQGIHTFYQLKAQVSDKAIVVLTGMDNEEVATQTMHEGAQDYLVKGSIDEQMLIRSLRYAIERKHSEKEARNLAIDYERNRLMKNFMVDAAHDIRTPLSIILTSLYLIVRSEEQQKREGYAHRIRQQVTRLEHLFEQVLEMAQLDSIPLLEMEPVNVNAILSRESAEFRARDTGKTLCIRTELQDGIPPILGDTYWITRAIQQLLENAILFSSDGEVIQLRSYRDQQTVVIEITDSGQGIPLKELPRIFERFYRVDKARQLDTGATGLGLAIVQRVITLHKGLIEAESTECVGSSFRMKFPMAEG